MHDRYSRQILFFGIGAEGQQKLDNKHALIIGAGALGTGSAEILARAGVGELTIVDRDYVEWSNLQRQQLYTEADAEERMPKVIAAKKRLEEINSEITIHAHIMDVTPVELEQLIHGVDLILDATDNFDIRMITNDISQKHSIPWIYGSCVGSYGISYTILPGISPCLHCLMESIPIGGMTCDTLGVISPVVQLVIAHQTAEALKILTENTDRLRQELISFDLWNNQQSTIQVRSLKQQQCKSCGDHANYPFLDYENTTKAEILCGRETVQIRPNSRETKDLETLAVKLAKLGKVKQNPYLLQFTIGDDRLVLFRDGRVLVHGTNDAARARSLYHRYLG
ncbi:thiazole biosynthesis adenylyltransferase ThiF [Virgibacillus halodenitrificans]|uniref:thiazole biosynthesis adenylyltransferase ThiF n=1 Tax=Virgibacillus halodenitrificans TaxID=1482 RepID=UPI001FB439B9|nr:thiazole biosynthesis adenylyltransferase ThiF [Virgibacillus halodenitrificans]MCJ0929927.1 thiazole biosynthesis adenylyltransferase ThiF [Virgibacillus halodenitrificans]